MYRLALPLVVLLFAVRLAAGDDPAPFRYSYYLFELPRARTGCSDCYIPLLVTREPLEKGEQPEAVVIVTYERDSIWTFAASPGAEDPLRGQGLSVPAGTQRGGDPPAGASARETDNPPPAISHHPGERSPAKGSVTGSVRASPGH